MMHQLIEFEPTPLEVKVDGMVSEDGLIQYWGIAKRQPNGKYHCLANVCGALCRVEVTLRFDRKGTSP